MVCLPYLEDGLSLEFVGHDLHEEVHLRTTGHVVHVRLARHREVGGLKWDVSIQYKYCIHQGKREMKFTLIFFMWKTWLRQYHQTVGHYQA